MNGHVEQWIDAYLDGELPAAQRQQVETHLEGCSQCRDLIEQARALSSLLHQAPPAAGLKPERQFVAEIGLQLDRRPEQVNRWNQILHSGWMLIPVGLCLAITFLETLFMISLLVQFIPGLKEMVAGQVGFLPVLSLSLPEPLSGLLNLFGFFDLFQWSWLTGLLGLASISILYLGWLASWWVRHQDASSTMAASQRS